MSEKQVAKKKEVVTPYKIPFMPDIGNLHLVPVGDHIIQHYKHSYDDHGNVIVVEADKEDLWKSIPQFQDEVGPKNVIRMIEAGANPDSLLNSNRENALYGDVSDMDFKSVNEVPGILAGAQSNAQKALDEFNKKFNTSLDMKQFLDLYSNGLLQKHVEGVNNIGSEDDGNGEK